MPASQSGQRTLSHPGTGIDEWVCNDSIERSCQHDCARTKAVVASADRDGGSERSVFEHVEDVKADLGHSRRPPGVN